MNRQPGGRVVFFVANNVSKFKEVRQVLKECSLAGAMLRVKALEIQSDNLEEIARTSVLEAYKRCRLPVIVEDAGLFIEALNGFPGPYAAYVYRTIGNEGLLKLMKDIERRKAEFRSVIAYFSEELASPMCFHGQVTGEITVTEEKGRCIAGFGFDPIFKPVRYSKTFAEMDVDEKNQYSHRARAVRKFAEWYKGLGQRV